MKIHTAHLYRLLMSSIFILALTIVQFPIASLAFDFRQPDSANNLAVPLVVYSNPASITIADRASLTSPNGISSPYPSTIAVSGLTGALSNLTVTLSGYNALRPRDNDFVLVGPGGQALMLMSD